MKVNLNTQCKVLLSEEGSLTYKRYARDVNYYLRTKGMKEYMSEEEETLQLSLWQIMHIFGPALGIGINSFFIGNVIYLEE